VDRFMSEARAITNLIGNGVAAVVVSRWEGELDHRRALAVLDDVDAAEEETYQAGHVDADAAVPDEAGRGPA
jgi:aerobic C4-dicarboxylate transport protein